MQQYQDLKSKHPDAILLFRVGDFYETFGKDAIKTADILGIVLTARNNGGSKIELAGFPHHSIDRYLPKLIRSGHRVAICEQLEKPSKEKKLVKRGITDIVTPGLTHDDSILDHKYNNFLASIFYGNKDTHGISFVDVTTGEYYVSQGNLELIDKLVRSFMPSEIIFPKGSARKYNKQFSEQYYSFPLDEWIFTPDYATEKLLEHFEVTNLKGFGIQDLEYGQIASGAILHYLASTENVNLKHINKISRIHPEQFMWLDRFTISNLELIYSLHESGVSLLDIMDRTISPMGARLLKKWILLPLLSIEKITHRHEMVSYFYINKNSIEEISVLIKQIGDLERLISKVSIQRIHPKEINQLKRALEAIQPIKDKLKKSTESLELLIDGLNPCESIIEKIGNTILEEPASMITKGGVIKDGCDEELDEYRNIIKNSKSLLIEIQTKEAEKTGITNLKIGFNNVFGYFLEVTNKYKNQGLIPDNWVRKQTLTNSERYITDELKQLETKILTSEDKSLVIEERIYNDLIQQLSGFIQPIQHNAHIVATLDCLISFAKLAASNNYSKPEINDGFAIDIKEARHPVIEKQIPIGESYIPNDIFLDNDTEQIMMITGPNMSGKSAVLRQTALICLMAQIGSFVPAKSAKIGIIDKLFTRVGASDNISSGESTFMVEMNETANIMNNISERSLILLDEIGRGTSTYDGISIAWAITEYLHENTIARSKTLFATHYHELNELSNRFDRIHNYNISSKDLGNKIIFLRKLVRGGSEHSFGIHVAKMAGMPIKIINRAKEILHTLEEKSIDNDKIDIREKAKNIPYQSVQLSMFDTIDPKAEQLLESFKDIDLNSMTPLECMMKLNELKKMLEED